MVVKGTSRYKQFLMIILRYYIIIIFYLNIGIFIKLLLCYYFKRKVDPNSENGYYK